MNARRRVSELPNPLRSAVSVTEWPASSRSLAVSNLMSSTYLAGVVLSSSRNSRVRWRGLMLAMAASLGSE